MTGQTHVGLFLNLPSAFEGRSRQQFWMVSYFLSPSEIYSQVVFLQLQ